MSVPYNGPDALREPILAALQRVLDPEVAMSIVDVGLVYGVSVAPDGVRVRMTMTSAACPMGDLMVDDLCAELEAVLPAGMRVDVELVWEPPWTPERMSAEGKALMRW